MRNVSDKIVEEIKTQTLRSFFLFVPFMRWCGKMLQSRAVHRWQY